MNIERQQADRPFYLYHHLQRSHTPTRAPKEWNVDRYTEHRVDPDPADLTPAW